MPLISDLQETLDAGGKGLNASFLEALLWSQSKKSVARERKGFGTWCDWAGVEACEQSKGAPGTHSSQANILCNPDDPNSLTGFSVTAHFLIP